MTRKTALLTFLILTLLQLNDVLTTAAAQAAGIGEANPVAKELMADFGVNWWWPKLAFVTVLGLAVAFGRVRPRVVRGMRLLALSMR